MHKNTACQLLGLSPSANKAQITAAYIQQINVAEDAIDDAVDVAQENAAWQHYKELQQARSLLLKALNNPVEVLVVAEQSTGIEKADPPAMPLTVDSAFALLGLVVESSYEQIQQAYQLQLQQLDNAIDQVTNPVDAEPLWEQHKRVQQARYLLLHARASVEQASQQYSKKLLHACAELGVNGDSPEQEVRKSYNQKMCSVEDQLDAVDSPQQEEPLWERQRRLQRAFSIFVSAQAATPEPVEPFSATRSSHQKVLGNSASLDDFLKQQKRHTWYRLVFRVLLLCLFLAAGHFAWQNGYLKQAKEWLLPPLSSEQPALQEPVLKLQAEVQVLREELETKHEKLRIKALAAAHADSADYPKLVRLRNSLDKQILQSPDFSKAKRQQDTAGQFIERQDYIAAEASLLSARDSYQALKLRAAALDKKPNTAKLKRRIPITPEKAKIKPVAEPVVGLPILSAAQLLLMPKLIDIPKGSFMMGDAKIDDAQPVHKVNIAMFKLGESEVSVKHFRQFVQQTKYQTEAERNIDEQGCSTFSEDTKSWAWRSGASWKSPGFEQGEEAPVVCLSWADVQAYLNWLRGATGWNVRLASEAEWEYAARAGTSSAWFWGDKLSLERANCEDCNQDWEIRQTFASQAYPANAFGLHSMPGNVWELLQDCWEDDYVGAPDNGQARLSGDCAKRVIRGGSWFSPGRDLRSGARSVSSRLTYRSSSLGFRIAVSY